ncbi:MAG: PD40 domain-containing protein [Gammaproteobacteria bacterium]|nr:PD40 domain-containing protein [Gammaproteobacteria bacterium]MBU2678327.1 PD40 domain-containing protein [Gammaproteobacteria bacterium]NNC56130.1 amidohydrolase family protein [Woeseiaceae bacterium]NNL52062.1 amidohydrolase family protein [Woeseiaceae bacterium]
MFRFVAFIAAGLFLLPASPLDAQEIISRGGNIAADIASDGRVAIDLMGDIWIVPPGGGKASAVTRNLKSVRRPRWSPDTSRIAYQAASDGTQSIWLYDFSTDQSRKISRDNYLSLHPAWHPDGERLVYASDTTGFGFDLWEVDLPTGLHWRISHHNGDETNPAWSSDGRDLVYIRQQDDVWSLILRRHGLPEEILLSTTDRLAGPAWRPDGSLIAYIRKGAAETTIEIVILSEPRVIRTYASGEDPVLAPLSWLDRHRMLYTANGVIRQRLFNSWTSSALPFQATLTAEAPVAALALKRRPLPRIDEPAGRLIIHASRLFDGVGGGYQADKDIVIDGGRITSVEPHSDRADSNIINMGDLTVVPGYIDTLAKLPEKLGQLDETIGPWLLTTGVTTIVADHADAMRVNTLWSGKETPGPRLLSALDWPVQGTVAVADSMTPGLSSLLRSRQASLVNVSTPVARRFSEPPSFAAGISSVVLGSADNGLPAGLALHAEFRALAAAGLRPEQALKAAGVNAAAALRLDPLLGRIGVGAVADLVFIDGDPLRDINDALNIVAIVRNGRFFSVRGLIDRLQTVESVE